MLKQKIRIPQYAKTAHLTWLTNLLIKQHAHQQGKGVIGKEGIGFGIAGEEY